jgi:phosphatidylglycerophosphate synthase
MKLMKYFADFLTGSRLLIAIILSWLGWITMNDVWQVATFLVLYAWTSDVLDGALARRSKVDFPTWIGNHDLYFDMAVATGLLIFFTARGSINSSVSIIFMLSWILIFSRFGVISSLGKLFQAPIYGWFIFATFRTEPLLGGLILIFLLIMVVMTWPRFPNDTIPSFLTGFKGGIRSSR